MEIAPTPLRRRNSIATTTTTTTASITSDIPFAIASSPSSFDFDFISLKPSSFVAYTSLRDIISSPANSSSSSINGDLSIRNRLVKQAAWSYLQPTVLTSSQDSPASRLLRRLWIRISDGFRFFRRVFHWICHSIRVPLIVK